MSFKKLYNSSANSNNALVIHDSETGCCGSSASVCKYSGSVDPFADGLSITLTDADGTATAYTFAAGTDTVAELREEIITAFASAGYAPEAGSNRDDNVKITTSGTVTTIAIFSEITVTKITATAGDITMTEYCTPYVKCDFEVYYDGGSDVVVTLDGTSDTMDGPHTYGTTEASTVATAIAGAITGEYAVTVTDDDDVGAWLVVVELDKDSDFVLDGTQAEEKNCVKDYTS